MFEKPNIKWRTTHAAKNVLLLPGACLGFALNGSSLTKLAGSSTVVPLVSAFVVCSIVAAWNYTLNDFFDIESDRSHPEKRIRVLDGSSEKPWLGLLAIGAFMLFGSAALVWVAELGNGVALILGLFALSGAIYNIPPIRLKRFPFVDVVVEALNFPIRLALGWYAVAPDAPLPPLSSMLAIWAFGGVLLTGKRAAEMARIGDPAVAHAYRPALLHYTRERALVVSSLYGMVMLFGAGVLFAVYPPLHNLIFLSPFVLLLMGIYLWKLADGGLGARELEPEKLLRRPAVWLTGLGLGLISMGLCSLPVDLTEWLGFFRGRE